MALILNIETATTSCSVCLSKDEEIIAFKEQNDGYTHAENLTIFIQKVMEQSNFTLNELDAIAISMGPGSYTGLRIGVSTAKGLCYALGIPLIAVPTLQHLALSVSSKKEFANAYSLYCPMIDARRMEVYCAIYDDRNNEIKPVEAKIISDTSFIDLLATNQILFLGNGADKCKSALSSQVNAHFEDNIELSAKNMVTISTAHFNENKFNNVVDFEPFYLKDFLIKTRNV